MTNLFVFLMKHIKIGSNLLRKVFIKIDKGLESFSIKLPFINKRDFILDFREPAYLYLLREGHFDDLTNLQSLNLIINENDIVFDIGANIGYMSFFFHERCQKVYAFEPSKRCQYFFNLNLLPTDNIIFEQSAVGSKKGNLDFYENTNLAISRVTDGLENSTHLSSINDKSYKKYSVPQTTIDDYCLKNKIYPNLIKIDVEGFEGEVIKGMEHVLNEIKPILYYEAFTSNRFNILKSLLNDITNKSYDLYYSLDEKLVKCPKNDFIGMVFAFHNEQPNDFS